MFCKKDQNGPKSDVKLLDLVEATKRIVRATLSLNECIASAGHGFYT
jgi:hypothetical protein